MQDDAGLSAPEGRKAYMHWVVRDPRAGGWLKSEFEVMSLLDSSGHIFRSHVHVTGECPPVSLFVTHPVAHLILKCNSYCPSYMQACYQSTQYGNPTPGE